MQDQTNRRESFRLDDTMRVHIQLLDKSRVDEILLDFDAFRVHYCLKSHFLNQKEFRLPKLLLIRKRDPEVAQYLEFLEQQILLIASRISSASAEGVSRQYFETEVNLSSIGLRLKTSQQFEVDDMVELGMFLSTSNAQVVMVATVNRIENSEEAGNHLVSLAFTHLHTEDSEAIIRHMAKLQQHQLQTRLKDS